MHGRPWHLYLIAAAAVAVIVLAVTQIGAPTSSARTARELVTAEDGIVQSTVTGTGNVEPGSDVDVNFQAGGTLSQVFVHVGQHVIEGQLLATLDPTSAQLTLDQAQSSLASAQDQLSSLETGSSTTTSYTPASSSSEFAAYKKPGEQKPATPAPTRTVTVTAPASKTPAPASNSAGRSASTPTTTSTTPSPSSIASAQAAVYSAEANVQSAEQAVAKTQLHAPAGGTIVSLAGLAPGDQVSVGSTGSAPASSASASSSGTSGAAASAAAGTATTSQSSGGGGSSSSAPFAEIVDSSTMTMTVSFSESDISKLRVGQPATVTIDALSGVELAAHVSSIAPVGTSSSGVVSYSATLTLDQTDPRVKPGMSASASVIVGQAQGVTVPNQAVTSAGSLGTVQVMDNGKAVSRQVIVGLRGDSRTQIISGLSSGQQLVVTIALPSLGSSSSSTTPSSGTLGGGRFGGGGFFGGGGAGFRGAAGGGLAARSGG